MAFTAWARKDICLMEQSGMAAIKKRRTPWGFSRDHGLRLGPGGRCFQNGLKAGGKDTSLLAPGGVGRRRIASRAHASLQVFGVPREG
jgi:hypothetical protein